MPRLIACDLRRKDQIAGLFQNHPVRSVIHLAALLPSAFQADPLAGADLNLTACFNLIRQSLDTGVQRFVFASSVSVYGSALADHALTEDDPAAPDDPYGAAKLAVEVVGQALARSHPMQFVSLRIARVIGPGIRKTASPWRSQIFEPASNQPIRIHFAPDAALSLVHVEDVARMLVTLAQTSEVHSPIYNTPAETWTAKELKEVVEKIRGICVELGEDGSHAGPIFNGSRFSEEFSFQLRGLRERLSHPNNSAQIVIESNLG